MANTKTPVDQSADSITNGPAGLDIDVMTALNQIGVVRRMRIGFVVGSVLYDRDWFKFQVSLDHKARRWVIVKLNADDTYSVEFGRLVKKFYWAIEKQLDGVYADNLGEVIERLFVEVYS